MAPSLSIVLCTIDRAPVLSDALDDVLLQAPRDAEILVVDQSRGPQLQSTAARIRHLDDPRLTHLPTEPRGLPEARNMGVVHTSAPLVLFLDDDVRLSPGCVRAHMEALGSSRVGGVVGRTLERSLRPNAPATVNELTRSGRIRTNLTGRESVRVQLLKGANMSLRREALEAAGPFDRGYLGTAYLEEADMSVRVARQGWELWFAPEAELTHLSAPRGGVRQGTDELTERWRFHNTGYFVRKHRPARYGRVRLTFAAIAARRALQWRDPGAAARLMDALAQGYSR